MVRKKRSKRHSYEHFRVVIHLMSFGFYFSNGMCIVVFDACLIVLRLFSMLNFPFYLFFGFQKTFFFFAFLAYMRCSYIWKELRITPHITILGSRTPNCYYFDLLEMRRKNMKTKQLQQQQNSKNKHKKKNTYNTLNHMKILFH